MGRQDWNDLVVHLANEDGKDGEATGQAPLLDSDDDDDETPIVVMLRRAGMLFKKGKKKKKKKKKKGNKKKGEKGTGEKEKGKKKKREKDPVAPEASEGTEPRPRKVQRTRGTSARAESGVFTRQARHEWAAAVREQDRRGSAKWRNGRQRAAAARGRVGVTRRRKAKQRRDAAAAAVGAGGEASASTGVAGT